MWSNMQESALMRKLDRFILSSVWDEMFPFSKGESLPRPISDHMPILLNGKVPKSDFLVVGDLIFWWLADLGNL